MALSCLDLAGTSWCWRWSHGTIMLRPGWHFVVLEVFPWHYHGQTWLAHCGFGGVPMELSWLDLGGTLWCWRCSHGALMVRPGWHVMVFEVLPWHYHG